MWFTPRMDMARLPRPHPQHYTTTTYYYTYILHTLCTKCNNYGFTSSMLRALLGDICVPILYFYRKLHIAFLTKNFSPE
jgi:hypothetical protein